MADYKVVDVEKLETELTEVADEVRILADTQEKMSINKMTENVAQANDTIEAQKDIILEIKATLEGKASGSKEEQEKTLSITENGSYEILPDENKTLSKVNIEANIALGEDIGKPYIDTSKITDFSYFFYNGYRIGLIEDIDFGGGENYTCAFQSCDNAAIVKAFGFDYVTYFTETLFPSLDLGYPTTLQQCFANTQFKYLPKMNTVNCISFSTMLSYCRTILEISLDTSNGTSFGSMCQYCSGLKKVSLTTAKNDFSTSSFQGCTALTDITIGEGWAVSIYLHYSENLTVESLHGMIENLADLTGKTAKTFQIGATNLAKIDEEHLTMLQNKNWNYL